MVWLSSSVHEQCVCHCWWAVCLSLSVHEWCVWHCPFMNGVFGIVRSWMVCLALSVHERCVWHCLFMNGVFGSVCSWTVCLSLSVDKRCALCAAAIPGGQPATTEWDVFTQLWPVRVPAGVLWPGHLDLPDPHQTDGGAHPAQYRSVLLHWSR